MTDPRADNGELPAAIDPEVLKLYEFKSVALGVTRLERWPEGLVLWSDGRIVWKSWESKPHAERLEDELDAARYRWLREQHILGPFSPRVPVSGKVLDTFVDSARLA